MKKIKKWYVSLDFWLEERGEKVMAVICLTTLTVLIFSLFKIVNGLG